MHVPKLNIIYQHYKFCTVHYILYISMKETCFKLNITRMHRRTVRGCTKAHFHVYSTTIYNFFHGWHDKLGIKVWEPWQAVSAVYFSSAAKMWGPCKFIKFILHEHYCREVKQLYNIYIYTIYITLFPLVNLPFQLQLVFDMKSRSFRWFLMIHFNLTSISNR